MTVNPSTTPIHVLANDDTTVRFTFTERGVNIRTHRGEWKFGQNRPNLTVEEARAEYARLLEAGFWVW